MTKVDVIIPYSQKHTPKELLERAKESANKQNIETNIIVRKDEGVAKARNKGIQQSKNRYIAFLDADDYWKPDKLKKQLEKMKQTNSGFSLTYSEDSKDHINRIKAKDNKDLVKQIFLLKITGFTSTIVIDTEKTSQMFDTELYRREDHLYAVKTLKNTDFCIVEEPLTRLCKHQGGLTSTESLGKKLEAHKQFYQKATNEFPYLKNYEKQFWSSVYHRVGRQYYYEANYDESINFLWKSVKKKPGIKNNAALIISLYKKLEISIKRNSRRYTNGRRSKYQ